VNVASIVFLHGLESAVDEKLQPLGRKAEFLRRVYGAETPALDTRVAVEMARQRAPSEDWRWPYEGYDQAFAEPLRRARAAIGPDTRLVIGSSFGGAVLLRLLHEDPSRIRAALFLAGAGKKLTPYTALVSGIPTLLVHGRRDSVVPYTHSVELGATTGAPVWLTDDEHDLSSLYQDGAFEAAIETVLKSP
jgi:pimeloyl-ACP methyl ester carboxylesterase